MATRVERDPLGELHVPAGAYYGVQTQRAVENFPISGLKAPAPLVIATVLIFRNGVSGPWRESARSPMGPFWPDQAFKDLTAGSLLLLLLIAPIMWFQRLQTREHEAAR